MARKKKTVVKRAAGRTSKSRRAAPADPLLATVKGATHRYVGHVRLDVGRAGEARVKRMIYPAGFRWSKDMKPVVGTDLCMHAHVGFLARGRVHGEYADGCGFEYAAPRVVVLEPGHDAWVVGDEPAVLIQFDAEEETARRFGLPEEHRHPRP
jgi:hypothetical protein